MVDLIKLIFSKKKRVKLDPKQEVLIFTILTSVKDYNQLHPHFVDQGVKHGFLHITEGVVAVDEWGNHIKKLGVFATPKLVDWSFNKYEILATNNKDDINNV